ncbi:UNVERIFIED_CONTAM: Phospholipase SGR2 [Sesamum latifolium]|uniref:Phospholipase SGR2 n=1 Tax=Sesamum latifolium TaxID=2727402 RepID=A0AAW2Y063_9LAMI
MDSDVGAGGGGGGGVEETLPDMLRNTPSNYRRLVNEIEQCEGRQKYLAHTRSPSDGGDVRWYFCKVPLAVNELAASVPQTEIVGKGDYFRFGMRDSLAIEAYFLQREDELLSSWWKEYAECSEGPKGTGLNSNATLQTKELSPESCEPDQLYVTEEERVGVPVKEDCMRKYLHTNIYDGGFSQCFIYVVWISRVTVERPKFNLLATGFILVDLVRRHSFPVYWNGENRRVLRGHWFARKGGLDWLPLREDVSEQLEYAYRTQVWHRRTFQQSGLYAARVDLQGSTPGLHALFTGEDDTWEAWLNVDVSGFSGVVGFGGNGIMLRRGYAPSQSQKPTQDELRQQKEEEMDDYCSQVDTFFAVGSPLGVFLSLRNIRIGIGKGKEYWKEENINEEMPACRRVFNIFHPFDPVAYRNYWRDSDTALFMLKHLYRDIPEEPILAIDQLEDSSKDENGLTGWFDPREVADEELPLTFADSVVTECFSHNVKKMMKK